MPEIIVTATRPTVAVVAARPTRFCLIGCGKIARRHVDSIRMLDGSCVQAIADPSDQARLQMEETLGVASYPDYRQMLDKEDADVVCILTPSGTHAAIALEVMTRHRRHLIVEKPLALQTEDANLVVRTAQDLGLQLFVTCQNRFNPPILMLREAVRRGRFGRMVLATTRLRWCRPQGYYDQGGWRGTWALDGGVFANQAIHHIDLLLWLMGPVESVVARGYTALSRIETEDVGAAILRFTSGALGVVEATTCARPKDIESSISVLGDKGSAEIAGTDLDQVRTWAFEDKTPEDCDLLMRYGMSPNESTKKGHEAFYAAVLAGLRTRDIGCLTDGAQGRRCVELLCAIYESMETGREITLRFRPRFSRLGVQVSD